jgi:hypothetical protein
LVIFQFKEVHPVRGVREWSAAGGARLVNSTNAPVPLSNGRDEAGR